MTLVEVFKLLLLLTIVLNVLAIALEARTQDVAYLFREWRLGLRALVAMFVVVPAVAILIAYFFDLKPAVKVALVVLAFSPVPPILPKKQLKAGGSASYVTGLLVAAAIVSLVVAPLGIELIGTIFGLDTGLSAVSIARVLAIGIALPLVLGLIGQRVLGDRTPKVAAMIARVASIMLLVGVVVLIVVMAPAMWTVIGDGTIVALIAMILAGLAAGYWLGGDVPQDKVVLSLAAATRHPGVAITIATSSFADAKLAPAAILLFVVLNAIVTIPWLRYLGKRASAAT
ncbi:transporter [Sphingomonas sp. DBB INV C78]|uniref:hypothetical protein n=1 Tax=Sphingomonas sp. DBB INV C78 TaxID=3349434 RepID=UPI0036D26345